MQVRPARGFRHRNVAVVGETGDDRIHRVLRQVLGERRPVSGIERKRAQVRAAVRAHDGLGRRPVDIRQLDSVSAGFR